MRTPPTARQRVEGAFRLGRALRLVYRASPRWFLANAGLVVVQGAMPLAGLYAMKRILDAVSAAMASPNQPELVTAVWTWIAFAAGVGALTALARVAGDYMTRAQSLQVTDAVNEILHDQSIAVDLAYYEDPSYFDTLHRAQGEAAYRPMHIVTGLTQLAQNGLAATGIAGWLFTVNAASAALLGLAILPGIVLRLVHSRRLYRLQVEQTAAQRRSWYYHQILTDAFHAKELRIFNLGGVFKARYRELRTAIRDRSLALGRRYLAADFLGQLLATLALFGFLASLVVQALRGSVSIGDLAVYYLGFQSGLTLLQTVLRSLAGLYEDNLFLTNLYRFLDLEPKVVGPTDPDAVPRLLTSPIEFRNVSFRYPSHDTDALRQVDLTLRPGEVLALVGENGSGKSTLAKLLCRLYDPTQGAITVGDVDLRRFDPVAWRREISVLFQDYGRYSLTAKENIWIGDVTTSPDASRISEAAHDSGAHTVISSLPQGYDTTLGRLFESGQDLSGGEWQRIAMARAFWRKAGIVILDEPSSALDPLAEADFISRFRKLLGGRTALIISHRLSSTQMADRICVLEHGRIVETGTHAALLARDGAYARLYLTQAQHYQPGQREA